MDALISVKNLCVQKGKRKLLDDVSFDVMPGEAVSLIGPNGAGKTTLIRAIIGILNPTKGAIERRTGLVMGYTPQKLQLEQLMPMPVDRFLALSRDSTALERLEMLTRCDAAKLAVSQLADLSGGEMQRVLLARALMRSPQLLILDEPTAGLDDSSAALLVTLVNKISRESNTATIFVSHRKEPGLEPDKIFELQATKNGSIGAVMPYTQAL